MSIKTYIPSAQSVVKVAISIVIIAILTKVLPIPENYKQYFRV